MKGLTGSARTTMERSFSRAIGTVPMAAWNTIIGGIAIMTAIFTTTTVIAATITTAVNQVTISES